MIRHRNGHKPHRETSDYIATAPSDAFPRSEAMLQVMMERVKQRVPVKQPGDHPGADDDERGGKIYRQRTGEEPAREIFPIVRSVDSIFDEHTKRWQAVTEVVKEPKPLQIVQSIRVLPQNLKKIRTQKRLSRRSVRLLCMRLGCPINQNALWRYETGAFTPHIEAALALARALDVSLNELVTESDGHQSLS